MGEALSWKITASDMEEELADLLRTTSLGGGQPSSTRITGTRALMLAVLEDAIRCYLDGGKCVAEEATAWIDSNWRSYPFTFVIVCETLGLEPQAVRKMLHQMKEEKVSSRQAIPRARKNVRVPGRVCLRASRRRLAHATRNAAQR